MRQVFIWLGGACLVAGPLIALEVVPDNLQIAVGTLAAVAGAIIIVVAVRPQRKS